MQDEDNYYRYGIQGETGVLSLYKRIGGKWRQLRTAPFIAEKGKWYALRVQVEGQRITCFIDNQRIMALDDDTFEFGGICIGVLEDAQKCDYKNIYVKKSINKSKRQLAFEFKGKLPLIITLFMFYRPTFFYLFFVLILF